MITLLQEWRREVLGAIDTPIMRILNGYERISLAAPSRVWTLLDPAVAAMVLDNSIVQEYRNTSNGIILCGKYLIYILLILTS